MEDGGGPPPPLPPELDAFKCLVASYGKRKVGPYLQRFVKKADIPFVEFPTERSCHMTLNLVERGLIGKFSGL